MTLIFYLASVIDTLIWYPKRSKRIADIKMKTEKEKMAAGERYWAHGEEMIGHRAKVKPILHKLNVTEYYTDKFQDVKGTMVTGGDTNRTFSQKQVSLNNGKLSVKIQPNGGFVIVF